MAPGGPEETPLSGYLRNMRIAIPTLCRAVVQSVRGESRWDK